VLGSRVRARRRAAPVPNLLTLSESVASEPVSIHLHMRNPLAWHLNGRA
jgi:hypothetical protein